jgi:HEAT repeat protein
MAEVMRVVLAAVLLALGLLLVAVAARRLTTHLFDARRARLVARSRPLLLQVLAEDEADPADLAALAAVPDAQWRVLEPAIVAMLAKVRGGARDALVEVLDRRGTLDRAERRTRSRSWVRRCEGAEMLGAARRGHTTRALVPLLADRNAEVRRVATRALGRVGSRDAVRPLLEATVAGPGLSARDVASALVLLEPEATPLLAGAAAEARDPQVRAVAVEVLGLRGATDATELLVALLEHDPDPEVRIRCARAMGRLAVPTAAGPLSAALVSDSPELRAVAARALGALGTAAAVDALVDRLDDPWHRVAANAAESLAALGGPGLAALRTATGSTRGPVAAHAAEALAVHAVGSRSPERAGR